MKEFKEFITKGNVVDLAVAVIIGAAFKVIISSLVNDIILPPIGLAMGGVNFSDLQYVLQEGVPAIGEAAEVAAVTINYGNFIQVIIDFLIIAFVIFMMIKGLEKAKKKEEEAPAEEPAAPEPTKEEILLGEIRDLLKK